MNQAARTGYGSSFITASQNCMGSRTVYGLPVGFHQSPRSNAVVVRPPAKVVTPPPWTPMFPVIACSVSSACMCRSPWYQWDRPNPTRTANGLIVPHIWARETICAVGTSVSCSVYSGVYLLAMSASACSAVPALTPPAG